MTAKLKAMAESLSQGEMRDFVSRISYKPGWRFEFVPTHQVRVYYSFDSSRGLERVGSISMVSVPLHRLDCLNAIYDFILDIERHEIVEWLAVDGMLTGSPHGEPPFTIPVVNRGQMPWI